MKEIATIFDMDGVIAHTNPYHAKAFEVFLDQRQIAHSEAEFEQHMYGKHNSHIFTYFFKRPIQGEELLALEREKEGLFREIYAAEAKPIPYLPEFLADLKEHQIKLAVATSAPRANMDLILNKLEIFDFFSSTLSSENVELHKPHPEVYLKSAENLQIQPSNCFVFEDSFSGVTAGINAGMNVIGVLSTHTKQELPPCIHYIDNYKEMNSKKLADLLINIHAD
ncbi:HAD family hydrolase [Sphingobacterium sp. HJSM2_6]|uniref:HAD family hydrolase n=1 Tax=Sphingobacterium sp. HJSM2_6 TaxID=3366264 RepID=UPI003BBC5FA3